MNIATLIEKLRSKDKDTHNAAKAAVRTLKAPKRKELIETLDGGTKELHKLLTGLSEPVIDKSSVSIPSQIIRKAEKQVHKGEFKRVRTQSYGIYSVSDANFFPGIVASINSLRAHHCNAVVAVIDIGLDLWMINYLKNYDNVTVLDINEIKHLIRYTDTKSDKFPVFEGWAYKAFGIIHFNLFDLWTFIDADYFALCNIEEQLKPLVQRGHFVSTEDGSNTWNHKHQEAIGVQPGRYQNINAGFISVSMKHHDYIIHEWRNLMTRQKPFGLWYGDQGALNAILDKYNIEKVTIDKRIWNQTLIVDSLMKQNAIEDRDGTLYHKFVNKPLCGWHGVGWHKLWHQIGIDMYRTDPETRKKFYLEAQKKSPAAVAEHFKKCLFMNKFNKPLRQHGHRISA